MRRVLVPLAIALCACEPAVPQPPPPPPPIDQCVGLSPMAASIVPTDVRVNGAATVSATGGSGRYTFAVSTNASGGAVSGDRYVAGPTPGTDVLTASDDCGNAATVSVVVGLAFSAKPARATVKPGTRFTVEVQGLKGAAVFQGQALGSGGSISPAGEYVAGATPGLDLIVVRDSLTGDQAILQYQVTATATFRATPAKLALPTGSFVRLVTADGSGEVTWSVLSGMGTLERDTEGDLFRAPTSGAGTTELEGRDRFTQETTRVSVRLLTELTRPNLVAQGRRTDVANLVTGDFDGDGVQDVALGVPESDLSRPQGGAVFIFKGSATGLPAEPTWTITGNTDTAQFGSVMAAGDLDGDGRADLAISAPGDDVTIADSGAVYLYAIGADGPRPLRAALTGLGRGNFGAALAIADVDGDGDNDLVVGSPGADIAPGAGFTSRGVVDLFVLQRGQPIPDLGAVRLSGADLAADGTLRRFSNIRFGRSLVAADLNDDGIVDLAFHGAVNNTLLGGMAVARSVNAIQVHFGRNAMKRFEDQPDLYVLPANTADGDEGTVRLGFSPKAAGVPPLLVVSMDRADSPNLSMMGGNSGGSNGGGALLFNLTAQRPTGTPGASPTQVGRTDAYLRLYGDQSNIQAGRSFAITDIDADGAPELALGAPYATSTFMVSGMNVSVPLAGRLLFYRLTGRAAGDVSNKPDALRAGTGRADTLGTGLATWAGRVVSYASRASTALGDFTGRLDTFSAGADPSAWTATSVALPNKPASQQFGAAVAVAPVGGGLRAVVGVPNISGPASDSSGNETGAGQAIAFAVAAPDVPRVLMEGANTAYVRDGGWRAFGGRPIGTDVAMTDFDGDGRMDAVFSAPNFTLPTRMADGGTTVMDYATNRPECMPTASQTTGAAMVHLGQADGTFKEGFRVWAVRDIANCTVPDGGAASLCQRSALGRNGIEGNFDFDGDGRKDLALARTNGLEIFGGRAPDDATLAKPSMACDALFTLPTLPWPTFTPTGLGDLDGDGCDEVSLRYSDNNNRRGLIVLFGFDAGGARCGGRTAASWVRISGDTETGVTTMRLGLAATRAGRVLRGDTRDFVAVTAELYPYLGQAQPTVLLIDAAAIVAKRPASGERLASILGDGLDPIPIVYFERAPGFGRMLWGSVDVTGDGREDLVVSATDANVNGDGTGAVFVFAGGSLAAGPNVPAMTVVADSRERAAFGADLWLSPAGGGQPAALAIGAPLSYRSGTANGTAFVLPLDF
ncbi:MAG: VCBS repeat-containing protein [Myxococcota bacterium]